MHLQTRSGEGMRKAFMRHDHRTRRHRPNGHARILDPLPHPGTGHLSDNRLGVFLQKKTRNIGVMHDDIRDHSATSVGRVDPPPLQMPRQMHRMMDAQRKHLSDTPIGNEITNGSMTAGTT